jgi:glycine C-acetyltransferase
MDLFKRLENRPGPLGRHAKESEGYYMFPKLEGPIGPRMQFRGRENLVWSLNNYLGLANHPDVREADAQAAADYGMAWPMGARMMSGNSNQHEQLERELAHYVGKEAGLLVNYGYQAMVSSIDALVDRHDVIVYDAESHACIVDGVRLHAGKRFVYKHNDMAGLRTQLVRARRVIEEQGHLGGILVITEGVFGMSGALGSLDQVVALKKEFEFRLLVDDAHGFGVMGPEGQGTPAHMGVTEGVDLYFGTFAKAMASIGGFFAGSEGVIQHLRYNMRSQIFAKSLPMPLVIGALKRLEIMRTRPEYRNRLWEIVHSLQSGLKERGFNLGPTASPVTPVILSGSLGEATGMVADLRENWGIFCSVVVYPVVPKDVILLRLIPTAVHTDADVAHTLDAFSSVAAKLADGAYRNEGIVVV